MSHFIKFSTKLFLLNEELKKIDDLSKKERDIYKCKSLRLKIHGEILINFCRKDGNINKLELSRKNSFVMTFHNSTFLSHSSFYH